MRDEGWGMSDFVWRMHILVERQSLPAAKEAATRVLPGGGDEARMFGVALMPDASDASDTSDMSDMSDAALYGCSTLLTEAQRAALMAAFEAASIGARWVRLNADGEDAAEASSGLAAEMGRRWLWEDTLAAIHAAKEDDDG